LQKALISKLLNLHKYLIINIISSGILNAGRVLSGMKSQRFELFQEMVCRAPAQGILRAIELEEWLIIDVIIDHLANQRDLLLEDIISILSFRRFLDAVKSGKVGGAFSHGVLPGEHIPFYHETVKRMIEAGELPDTAQQQFDDAFSSEVMKETAAETDYADVAKQFEMAGPLIFGGAHE
jgi:hypothetical protein